MKCMFAMAFCLCGPFFGVTVFRRIILRPEFNIFAAAFRNSNIYHMVVTRPTLSPSIETSHKPAKIRAKPKLER